MQLLDYFIALKNTSIPLNFLPPVFQNINTELGGHYGMWSLYWALKLNPWVYLKDVYQLTKTKKTTMSNSVNTYNSSHHGETV